MDVNEFLLKSIRAAKTEKKKQMKLRRKLSLLADEEIAQIFSYLSPWMMSAVCRRFNMIRKYYIEMFSTEHKIMYYSFNDLPRALALFDALPNSKAIDIIDRYKVNMKLITNSTIRVTWHEMYYNEYGYASGCRRGEFSLRHVQFILSCGGEGCNIGLDAVRDVTVANPKRLLKFEPDMYARICCGYGDGQPTLATFKEILDINPTFACVIPRFYDSFDVAVRLYKEGYNIDLSKYRSRLFYGKLCQEFAHKFLTPGECFSNCSLVAVKNCVASSGQMPTMKNILKNPYNDVFIEYYKNAYYSDDLVMKLTKANKYIRAAHVIYMKMTHPMCHARIK